MNQQLTVSVELSKVYRGLILCCKHDMYQLNICHSDMSRNVIIIENKYLKNCVTTRNP